MYNTIQYNTRNVKRPEGDYSTILYDVTKFTIRNEHHFSSSMLHDNYQLV